MQQVKHTITLEAGGWCLAKGKMVSLSRNESYMLPPFHVEADEGLSEVLLSIFSPRAYCLRGKAEDECASVGLARKTTVNDFGAGVGQYGHRLRSEDPDLLWMAYDGAGNVEEYTDGFVSWFDLTIPLSLPRADWVVSLEVGEHIPAQFEFTVIRNLHAHNYRGIILSWAILGQKGDWHVNNHANKYIVEIFHKLGYRRRQEIDQEFRRKAIYPWFKHSIMVFERYNPLI